MAGIPKPCLGAIRAVTYAVPDLGAIERAYVSELGYELIWRGEVGEAEARAWGAPAAARRRTLVLGPASGEPVHLRFVETSYATGWRALKTLGWNATEFVVQDLDELVGRLGGGAFKIIGGPAPLTRFPMIRAMQAIGPGGECCYFTEVGPGSGLELAGARSFVGRVFIVVAAAADLDSLYVAYAQFANAAEPPVATPVKVISHAHGLPTDTLHRHGLIRLPHGTLIELDEYPPSASARTAPSGDLPPGMAMVSFEVDRLDGVPTLEPPVKCTLPGQDAISACLSGGAGSMIELVAPVDAWRR